MIQVLALVVAMFALLSGAGWCVLAPLRPEVRVTLLPAAPLFGAGLLAAVSSTATRWLAMPATLGVAAVVLAGLLALGIVRKRITWRVDWRGVVTLVTAPFLTVGGFIVAALPAIWVGDTRPTDATIIVDQFYFSSNATYLTDHPMLPGPYWNPADWVGSATPSYGPVVDVIANKLRYGQASVTSALSVVLHRDPSDIVTSVSLLWLVLVGMAAYTAATLLGVGRRWALGSVPVVTGSLYLISQALEGKNDGLLGVGLGLLTLALSYAAARTPGLVWPLALAVAGLTSTYSELVLVLLAPVVLGTLLGPRTGLLARLNTVGGAWALGVMLAPWAWIWLAQSARIGSRYSGGSTPWSDRHGLGVLRVVAGIEPLSDSGAWGVVATALAVLCVLGVGVGLAAAVALSPARGVALGLVLSLGALEVSGVWSDAGNLQYRTAQLGSAFALLAVIVGWEALARRPHRSLRLPTMRRPLIIAVALTFTVGNLLTTAEHLPRERAEVQHVPSADLDEAVSWVHAVGGANVSVVVPRFTDLLWLALSLRKVAGVGYPVVPAIYLGNFPHWDRTPDRYYLVGIGATVSGDARVVHRNSRYELVALGASGLILSPFQPTFYWARTTYMRGFPCVKDGAQMLLLRGSTDRGTFAVASRAAGPAQRNLALNIDGEPVRAARQPTRISGWDVQTFRAPRFSSAIINIGPTATALRAGTGALPVVFGDATLTDHLAAPDPRLTDFCLADRGDYTDGYDRDLTTLYSD